MLKKRKNKGIIYLKFKNGKIQTLDEPYQKDNENNDLVSNTEEDCLEFNKNIESKFNFNKLIIILGLFVLILPITFFGFKLIKNNIYLVQEYMILGENNNTDNDISLNDDIITPTNKIDIDQILEITNTVNISLKTSYNNLKQDITLFLENRESVYSTTNKLKSRLEILEKNKQLIINKKTILIKNKQEKLFNIFIERIDLLINTVSNLKDNINRTNAIQITNEAILKDNELLNNELNTLKTTLENNNIKFNESENKITTQN